jgi:hypothetical protein
LGKPVRKLSLERQKRIWEDNIKMCLTEILFEDRKFKESELCRMSGFRTEDGGSMFLRNVGIYLQVHTALLPRRSTKTALNMKMAVFWDFSPCSLIEID